MSSSKFFLLFFTFVASVAALSTPHARGIHHRALAGRIAVPETLDTPPVPLRRRQNSKRCKPRTSSAALAVSAKETSTKEAASEATTHKEAPAPTTHHEPPPPPPTHQAPAPTTHETTHKASPTPKPAPPPTTKEEPPATTKKPAPAPASGLPSYLTGTLTGDATFYATGLGACGIVNQDTDYIAAAAMDMFDHFPGYDGVNPNHNPICGRKVRASYKGKSVVVAITDRCAGCTIRGSLDFSPAAFKELGDESKGRLLGMSWQFI